MNEMELRPAQPEDEYFVRDLMIRTLEEELAAWAWPEPMRSQLLEMQYRCRVDGVRSNWPGSSEQLIVLRGETVGRVVVTSTGNEMRLLDIAVLPERRNAGIGAAAISKLLEEGSRSARPVRLNVNKSNRAGRLYERLGFVAVGGCEVQDYMEWTPAASGDAAQ